MWTLQWLSHMHPSTSPHRIFSPVKICINEEKLRCGKICTVLRLNVSCSVCKCAALAFIDFCEIIKFLHVYVCIVGGSCITVLWVTFVLSVCPPPRQTNVTLGLLCRGDIRRRRETEAVSLTTSGITLHTYWWISGLLNTLLYCYWRWCVVAYEIKPADSQCYIPQTKSLRFHFCSVKTCLVLCCRDVEVGLLIQRFGPDWNILTPIGWITMKVCTDIREAQRMNPNDFDDTLTFL